MTEDHDDQAPDEAAVEQPEAPEPEPELSAEDQARETLERRDDAWRSFRDMDTTTPHGKRVQTELIERLWQSSVPSLAPDDTDGR